MHMQFCSGYFMVESELLKTKFPVTYKENIVLVSLNSLKKKKKNL